jgi:hypothetical protein
MLTNLLRKGPATPWALGTSFFLGGLKHHVQEYNRATLQRFERAVLWKTWPIGRDIPGPAIQNLAAQEIGELAHGSDAWRA